MGSLFVIFLIAAVGISVLLYVGGYFLQGFFYTEPSKGLFWQAPAVGVAVAVFFLLWMLIVASSPESSPGNIPYDTLFQFSPRVEMFEKPTKKLWAVYKGGKTVEYASTRRSQTRWEYFDTTTAHKPWNPTNVEAILVDVDGQKLKFAYNPAVEGGYRTFVSDDGWTMREYDTGPTGIPVIYRTSRLLGNLLLNVAHFLIWFFGLWLGMRFLWPTALGLATVLWLVATLTVLPMILNTAASVNSPTPAAAAEKK